MWPQLATQQPGKCPANDPTGCPDGDCNGSKENKPAGATKDDKIQSCGGRTTKIGLKLYNSYSQYTTRSSCIKIPLKSGGTLDFAWNLLSGQGVPEMSVNDTWWPGGRGGVFSFMKYLATSALYRRFSDQGTIIYSSVGTIGDITYFTPNSPLSLSARYSSTSLEFSEFDEVSGTEYVYGGDSHSQRGRMLRRTDRNGNQIDYNYSNTASGNPILRKITGDVGSVIPYFAYIDESGACPITKVFLYDTQNVANSRSIYFQYQDTADQYSSFLQKITNPDGCVVQYGLSDSGTFEITAIDKEVDQEGYATYFQYVGGTKIGLRKVVEPGNRVSYFTYVDASHTNAAILGRPATAYQYAQSGHGNVADIQRQQDPLGNVTYYQYTSNDRVNRAISANGNVTYYEYNANDSLAKQVSASDGAASEYVYLANNEDVRKEIGPRNVAGTFPVVTYYGYDANRNRTTVVDALNNATYTIPDALGRTRKTQDARGNVTYFNYNAAIGTVANTRDAAGNITYFKHNSFHDMLRQVSPRWVEAGSYTPFTTYHEYDNLDRLTKTIDAEANETTLVYTSRGDLLSTTDPRGVETEYRYTPLRQMEKVATQDSLGANVQVQYFTYDTFKNRTKAMDPNNNWTYYFYDALDRTKTMRDFQGNCTYYFYDSVGNQNKVRDARLNTTYFIYDSLNRQKAGRDAIGNITYFFYDKAGNRIKIRDPRLNTTYYAYDALDRTRTRRNALNNRTYYFYDQVGNVSKLRDARLNTTYHFYDELNRRKATRDATAFRTYFFYDRASNLTKQRDARLNTAYFFYDTLDRQKAARDAVASYTYFFYDSVGNRKAMLDANGGFTYFMYDALSRPVCQRDALLSNTYFRYDKVGNRRKIVDTLGRLTYFNYDSLNRLTNWRTALGSNTYYYYDAVGNVQRMRNPRARTTYYNYDSLNRVVGRRDTLGKAAYFQYDPAGNTRKARNERGFWTYFAYDAVNRMTQAADALSNNTQYSYDAVGSVHKVTPPRGGTNYFNYDVRNLPTNSVDGVGNTTSFGYDATRSRCKIQSPRTNTTYFNYDAVNRLKSVQDAENGRAYFSYDPVSNLHKTFDALSRTTYFNYDALNRLTGVTDPLNQNVTYRYNKMGSRVKEVDALSHATYYNYNVVYRVSSTVDPLGKSDTFTYDFNLNVKKAIDRNLVGTYFTYDVLDRRSRIDYSDQSQYFTYDEIGNLLTTKDRWGLSTFAYDPLSRIARRTQPWGNTTYYAYDGASNRVKIQYPVDLMTAYYAYDNAQRMRKVKSVSGHTAYYKYDADSNVQYTLFGNGTQCYYAYDLADRVTKIRHVTSAGVPIAYFDYGRDIAGRIKRISREGDLAIYYQYDDIDRLTSEIWGRKSDGHAIYAFTYQYDAANNRTRMYRAAHGTTFETSYYEYNNANALLFRHTLPGPVVSYYKYDDNGALIKLFALDTTLGYGETQYGPDPYGDGVAGNRTTYYEYGANQLISRIVPAYGEAPTEFGYDASLNRYVINKAGVPTYYNWNGLNNLEERDSGGRLMARHTHGYGRLPGIGTIVETARSDAGENTTQTLHMDHRGTVYAVTNDLQQVQIRYGMDAFGRQVAGLSGLAPYAPNQNGYQANWLTINIGSRSYGLSKYRIYDPELGIFLSRDLLGTFAGPNEYQAFVSNPVKYVDSAGLNPAVAGCILRYEEGIEFSRNCCNRGIGPYKTPEECMKVHTEALQRRFVKCVNEKLNLSHNVDFDYEAAREDAERFAIAGEGGVAEALGEIGKVAVDYGQPTPNISRSGVEGAGQALKDIATGGRTAETAEMAVQAAKDLALAKRASEVQVSQVTQTGKNAGLLDEVGINKSTTAIGRTSSGERLVASSRNSLTKVQKSVLKAGEVPISGAGHAEVTLLQEGTKLEAIAASRGVCEKCAKLAKELGVPVVSPLKKLVELGIEKNPEKVIQKVEKVLEVVQKGGSVSPYEGELYQIYIHLFVPPSTDTPVVPPLPSE